MSALLYSTLHSHLEDVNYLLICIEQAQACVLAVSPQDSLDESIQAGLGSIVGITGITVAVTLVSNGCCCRVQAICNVGIAVKGGGIAVGIAANPWNGHFVILLMHRCDCP